MLWAELSFVLVLAVSVLFAGSALWWVFRLIRDRRAPGFPPTAAVLLPAAYVLLTTWSLVVEYRSEQQGVKAQEVAYYMELALWPGILLSRLLAGMDRTGEIRSYLLYLELFPILASLAAYFTLGLVIGYVARVFTRRKCRAGQAAPG